MYTTQDLLEYIKIKIAKPPLTDTQILLLASNELQDTVFPQIKEVRQGFNMATLEVPLEASNASYQIPDRAVGNTLTELKLKRDNTFYNLEKSNPGNLTSTSPISRPTCFYFSDDDVILNPPPSDSSTYTLVMFYERVPSKLVLPSATATIIAIDAILKRVTVSSNNTGFQGVKNFDVASSTGSQSIRWADAEASCSGTDITFTDELNKNLKLGDIVSLAGETSLIQLPNNYRTALAERTCELILESVGDYEAAQIHKLEYQELMFKAGKSISPRITYENPFYEDVGL